MKAGPIHHAARSQHAGGTPAIPPVIAPDRPRPRRSGPLSGVLMMLIAGFVALGVLRQFDPARHRFYPRCAFKAATGLDCPGCGGLRATHQLLRGNWRAALALNPLFVAGAPVLLLLGVLTTVSRPARAACREMLTHRCGIGVILTGLVAYTIARNLP